MNAIHQCSRHHPEELFSVERRKSALDFKGLLCVTEVAIIIGIVLVHYSPSALCLEHESRSIRPSCSAAFGSLATPPSASQLSGCLFWTHHRVDSQLWHTWDLCLLRVLLFVIIFPKDPTKSATGIYVIRPRPSTMMPVMSSRPWISSARWQSLFSFYFCFLLQWFFYLFNFWMWDSHVTGLTAHGDLSWTKTPKRGQITGANQRNAAACSLLQLLPAVTAQPSIPAAQNHRMPKLYTL
jgi:hypothetical protein